MMWFRNSANCTDMVPIVFGKCRWGFVTGAWMFGGGWRWPRKRSCHHDAAAPRSQLLFTKQLICVIHCFLKHLWITPHAVPCNAKYVCLCFADITFKSSCFSTWKRLGCAIWFPVCGECWGNYVYISFLKGTQRRSHVGIADYNEGKLDIISMHD